MKKLMLAGLISVGLIGTSCAKESGIPGGEAGWRTVANASVEAVQDAQVQNKAQQSIKNILNELQEFVSFGLKKIAEKSDAEGKKNLKELLKRFELLIAKYAPAIERGDFDALDEKAQEECQRLVQELAMFAMPLMIMLDQSDLSLANDNALMKSVRAELIKSMGTMIARVNKELE